MCTVASFNQLSLNAGGCIEFLRDTSELVDAPLVFTRSRRMRVRSEILRHVELCEDGDACVPGDLDACATPLAAALKTLVVGAEAVTPTTAPAADALPIELVHRICHFV